jgi:tetratricopeptide (TPR) repeat protein
MGETRGFRVAVTAVIALALLWSVSAVPALADELSDLNARVSALYKAGKYTEAAAVAERYVELAKALHGDHDPKYATAINWLATVFHGQGRYAEAEPLFKHALEIREKELAPDNLDIAQSLHNLAWLYGAQARYADAEQLYKRALAVRERKQGLYHPDLAPTINNLANLYQSNGRYAEAQVLHKRALAIREKALGPNHPDVAQSLANVGRLLVQMGSYADAEPLYKRALAIREKALGPDHPHVAGSLNVLGSLYRSQARYVDAERLYKRALGIVEKALGPAHLEVASTLDNLGELYRELGRYADAEPLFKRALAIRQTAQGHNQVAVSVSLNALALLSTSQARYDEAEHLYRSSLKIREQELGPDHLDVAQSLNNLGSLYQTEGRYADAEPLFKRALAIRETKLGAEHSYVATSLGALAELYQYQGRYSLAEPLFKRALAIREKALGPDHPSVAGSLHNLGWFYSNQARYDEAESLFKRAIAIREKALGPEHPALAGTLNSLGYMYQGLDRYLEAEPLHQRALAIREKTLGLEHPNVATSLNNLCDVSRGRGRYSEAERLCKRALEIREKVLDADHPYVGYSLNNLARLYEVQGNYLDAEPLYKRALEILEKALPLDHPYTAQSLGNLANLQFLIQRPAESLSSIRRATAILVERGNVQVSTRDVDDNRGEITRSSGYFRQHVRAAWRVKEEDASQAVVLRAESFRIAQWAVETETANALAQMAARFSSSNTALTALVRERQDLQSQWQMADKQLSAALSAPADRRAGADERARRRIAEIDARVAEIDRRLKVEFPEFFALSKPEPLSIEDATQLLHPDEALVVLLAGHAEETFVWALTRNGSAWQRIPVGAKALSNEIQALRAGVDLQDPKLAAQRGKLFDLGLAHDLYKTLLGPITNLIDDKRHLLIVPSGILTGLPFHLLVAEPPKGSEPNDSQLQSYREAIWLIRRYAVTVLPSVSSLRALRVLAKGGQAPKPLIGFGDPVFGPRPAPEQADHAPAQTAMRSGTRAYASYWRGTRADLKALRTGLTPLPETAAELIAVVRKVGGDLKLGAAATETTIKSMDLSQYRIVYFATHGLVSGEIAGLAEPALVLTLPKEPTELDDGLLTASEVAQLKLNADWVVLSACNTAAGNKPGAEALSGLARAFFYAGARALLVSHWQVDSDAAVRLTTSTFEELQKDPTIGRAEALRRAMLAMIDDASSPWNAYPDYWGGFSIVGEGGKS